jgi:hypothetical protein
LKKMKREFTNPKRLLVMAFALVTIVSYAQNDAKKIFLSAPVENKEVLEQYRAGLSKSISAYEVYKVNDDAIYSLVKNSFRSTDFNISLGHYKWDLHLERVDLRSPDYRFLVVGENGEEKWYPKTQAVTYRGYANGNPENLVLATIAEGFISVMIKNGNGVYQIEPVNWYLEDLLSEDYVVYNLSDFMIGGLRCGHADTDFINTSGNENTISRNNSLVCNKFNAVLYGANTLTTAKGSTANAEAYMNGLFNTVQLNYKQNHDVELVLTGCVASTAASNDPVTSTDGNVYIKNVTTWGKSGKLNQFSHDLAGVVIHTGSNGLGGIAGIANASAVCDASYKYMWTSDVIGAYTMAHEWGHMFGVAHDNFTNSNPAYDMPKSCPGTTGNYPQQTGCNCMMCLVGPAPGNDGMWPWSQKSKELVAAFVAKTTCKKACTVTAIPSSPSSNDQKVLIYPNPSTGLFTLDYTGKEGKVMIEVFNLLGEKVFSTQISLGTSGKETFDLSSRAKGAYFIRITNGEHQSMQFIAIE